jgi:hypothetical protein
MDLGNLTKKLMNCYIWRTALYGTETWTIRKADQEYLESFEMWCWRRMENISWTDRVRNEEVLHGVTDKMKNLHTIKERRVIGLISSCTMPSEHVTEGNTGETEVQEHEEEGVSSY